MWDRILWSCHLADVSMQLFLRKCSYIYPSGCHDALANGESWCHFMENLTWSFSDFVQDDVNLDLLGRLCIVDTCTSSTHSYLTLRYHCQPFTQSTGSWSWHRSAKSQALPKVLTWKLVLKVPFLRIPLSPSLCAYLVTVRAHFHRLTSSQASSPNVREMGNQRQPSQVNCHDDD